MFDKQIEALLTLSALSIFADKRVLSSEIQAFTEFAQTFERKAQSYLPITEAKLLLWFEMNRARLEDKMTLRPAGFKHWFESVLSDLSEFKDTDLMITVIKRISEADGEIHISERALQVLVEERFSAQKLVA